MKSISSSSCVWICAALLTYLAPVGPGPAHAALRMALSTLALEPFNRSVSSEGATSSCVSGKPTSLDKKEATAVRVFSGVKISHFTLQQQENFYLGEEFCPHEEGQGPVFKKFPQRGRKVESPRGPLPDLKPTLDPLPLSGNQVPHPPKHFLSPDLSSPCAPCLGEQKTRLQEGWVRGWPLCPRRGQGIQCLHEC